MEAPMISDAEEKSQPLTIYLLKDKVESCEVALADSGEVATLGLRGNLPFEGIAFYKKSPAHPPGWSVFVQDVIADDLASLLQSQHSSLVLFVKTEKRIFAVVFGYGRSLLHSNSFVRDFGLKVVLNAVDPEKLRCVNTNSLEEIPVETKQQASRVSAMEVFDIDRETEMMKSLVGVPKQGLLRGAVNLGKCISGAAALSLAPKIKAESLGRLCDGLLSLYKLKDYQKNGFDWVDNLRPVSDPGLKKHLDEVLLSVVKDKDCQKIHLTPPEILEWDKISGFRYSTDSNTRRELFQDLDILDYFAVSKDVSAMTREGLFKTMVTVKYADSDENRQRFRLYDCIVFDADVSGARYVLVSGMWFEVDKDYARAVERYVEQLREAVLDIPAAKQSEHEGEYTRRTCHGKKDLAHMDMRTVTPTNARSKIEVCDIFTVDRQFVHIKPYKGSSTLSHLFSQGTVSADLFQNDLGFRKKAKQRIQETNKAIASRIPASRDPDPRDFEIVYAIIKKEDGAHPWQKALPFFAQLNLRQSATFLRNRGYKVAVKLIPRI